LNTDGARGDIGEATRILVEHILRHFAARALPEARREAAPRLGAEQRAVTVVGAASLWWWCRYLPDVSVDAILDRRRPG
jgi:hypothetical protein